MAPGAPRGAGRCGEGVAGGLLVVALGRTWTSGLPAQWLPRSDGARGHPGEPASSSRSSVRATWGRTLSSVPGSPVPSPAPAPGRGTRLRGQGEGTGSPRMGPALYCRVGGERGTRERPPQGGRCAQAPVTVSPGGAGGRTAATRDRWPHGHRVLVRPHPSCSLVTRVLTAACGAMSTPSSKMSQWGTRDTDPSNTGGF